MRDLMRNYKMLLKRKHDSDSETESQPLMSSSCSSTQSFGTINKEPGIFNHDSCSSESDNDQFGKNLSLSPFTIPPPIYTQKDGDLFFHTANYQPQDLQVYTASQNIYDRYQHFTKINEILEEEPKLQKQKVQIVEPYPDYKDVELPATNSSLITIFAIWNTTLGSSLLSMSWGLEKTGLFSGIAINILIAGICLYTAYVLLNINERHGMLGQNNEVSDLCRMLIGRWAEIVAKIFSLVVLIGATIVYWILMSNFLYNSVFFLYEFFGSKDVQELNQSVICPKENTILETGFQPNEAGFNQIWNLYSTVPVFLGILMFPLLNFKSATFFTKFNSLGTFSILYLIVFVAIKSWFWGINIPDWTIEWHLKPSFCVLTGMLSLSYFIHNIIVSIMRNNKYQEHNGRDLTIAFGLITFTYLFVGVVFYISFPLAKSCIEDNILNNFNKRDVLSLMVRILLLFQLFTVYPLISYMLRTDIMANINSIFKNYRYGDFTYARVMSINAVIVFICIMFACFLPKIGTLIRYTGALSGLVYVFMLPSLLKITSLQKEGKLTMVKFVFNVVIIIIGLLNLLSQFFIHD